MWSVCYQHFNMVHGWMKETESVKLFCITFTTMNGGRAINFAASILRYIAMIHGLKDSTHLQHNMAKSSLCSRRSIMPKNVLASLANLMMFSNILYCEFWTKMLKITLAHLTADTQMFPCCVHPSVIGIWPIRHRNLCLSKSEWLLHSRQLKLDLCVAHHCQLQTWLS